MNDTPFSRISAYEALKHKWVGWGRGRPAGLQWAGANRLAAQVAHVPWAIRDIHYQPAGAAAKASAAPHVRWLCV